VLLRPPAGLQGIRISVRRHFIFSIAKVAAVDRKHSSNQRLELLKFEFGISVHTSGNVWHRKVADCALRSPFFL
jgi:hypothetical protein